MSFNLSTFGRPQGEGGGGVPSVGGGVEGGGGNGGRVPYADILKTRVKYDQRLKLNILEITLEKCEKDVTIDLDQRCVAKLLKNIEINIKDHIEGYQIKNKVISVWVANGIHSPETVSLDNRIQLYKHLFVWR